MSLTQRIATLLFALSLLIGGCTAGADKPRELAVMTYNIHHAEGMDKRLDVERIARVIRDAKPDLVALQELDAGANRTNRVEQAKELARLLKMHYVFGPAMEFDGGKYGDAVLSRYKIAQS